MKETEEINNVEEILGYECMTPNCGAVSMELLDYCPLCGKKDWRAIVTRKAIDKKKWEVDDIFDSWGLIKEEYLPFEAEVSITKNGVKKRDFEIKYSNSSFQKDETGAVSRFRMIDKRLHGGYTMNFGNKWTWILNIIFIICIIAAVVF